MLHTLLYIYLEGVDSHFFSNGFSLQFTHMKLYAFIVSDSQRLIQDSIGDLGSFCAFLDEFFFLRRLILVSAGDTLFTPISSTNPLTLFESFNSTYINRYICGGFENVLPFKNLELNKIFDDELQRRFIIEELYNDQLFESTYIEEIKLPYENYLVSRLLIGITFSFLTLGLILSKFEFLTEML